MTNIYCFNEVEYDFDALNELDLFKLETLAVHCKIDLTQIKQNTDFAYRKKRDKSGWEQSFVNRLIEAIEDSVR
jgi:predicted transposase YbfD/YdcC